MTVWSSSAVYSDEVINFTLSSRVKSCVCGYSIGIPGVAAMRRYYLGVQNGGAGEFLERPV